MTFVQPVWSNFPVIDIYHSIFLLIFEYVAVEYN